MILRGNDTLTVAGLKALVKYAKSGLPIILSGGLSSTWASNDEQDILQSEKALKSILDLDNVHQVPYGGLVDIIKKIGIVPRPTTDCNGTCSDSVLGYYVDSGKVWAKAAASDSATSVKLSSGKTVTLDQQGQSQISLGNWSVVLEQWLPPDNLYDVETVANKKNVSLSVSGFSLSSWKDLGYQNSSGVAISINGNEVPVIDITNPTTDVSTYLVQGDNTVVITVSSTLHNGLMPIWDQLLTGGAAPSLNYSALEDMVFQPQEYGILGEVRVVPYQLMRII
ncbi:unnamed protein product [Aspergillus oryzae var. brunneus]|uniref:Unnamed protein product n=1 Tax=Aspergillus oryzae var. brunneus TaxID=332754 RepID=A0ABQ6KZP1_ASPOZ|nr:unnamed protein product [Aspergillus oryzae var. brunneus]